MALSSKIEIRGGKRYYSKDNLKYRINSIARNNIKYMIDCNFDCLKRHDFKICNVMYYKIMENIKIIQCMNDLSK